MKIISPQSWGSTIKNGLARILFLGGVFVFIAGHSGVSDTPASQMLTERAALREAALNFLEHVQRFEGKRDPKCWSTASRLENMLSGLPLDPSARQARFRMGKNIFRVLWKEASQKARQQGRETIDERIAGAVAARHVSWEWEDKGVRLSAGNGPVSFLSFLEGQSFDHYRSVAYAQREMVSVYAEVLACSKTDELLPFDSSAAVVFKNFLDAVTLTVLQKASRQARENNETGISARRLDRVGREWRRAMNFPEGEIHLCPETETSFNGQVYADFFNAVIRSKEAAYQTYNALPSGEQTARRVRLIEQSAHVRMPEDLSVSQTQLRFLQKAMADFLIQVGKQSQQGLRPGKPPIIEAADWATAQEKVFPVVVDDQENVTFFPLWHRFFRDKEDKQTRRDLREPESEATSLGQQQRKAVRLRTGSLFQYLKRGCEGPCLQAPFYACDAFRDPGWHWGALREALASQPKVFFLDMDTAEIAAEAAAQYGWLLARLAGYQARLRAGPEAVLRLTDWQAARLLIHRLAQIHQTLPPWPSEETAAVVSSPVETEVAWTSRPHPFFVEVTDSVGVNFNHRLSPWYARWINEPDDRGYDRIVINSGGAAVGDINRDGVPDLLFTGGQGNALYLNTGRGRFEDVTRESGIDWTRPDGLPGEARQPLIVDLDNDGWQDIVISYVNDGLRIYRNLDGRHFEDVSARAGLDKVKGLLGPVVVLDYNSDGIPDIYAGRYGQSLAPPNRSALAAYQVAGEKGLRLNLDNQNADPNILWEGKGDFRFEDVSEAAAAAHRGWTTALASVDVNGDHFMDIIMANDYGRNAILAGTSQGRFYDRAREWGIDETYHSMNVGLADLNHDRFPDIYFSNINSLLKNARYEYPEAGTPQDLVPGNLARMIYNEANTLYVSRTAGDKFIGYKRVDPFDRRGMDLGWAWDADFFDADNDGDDDLYVLNGYNPYAQKKNWLVAHEPWISSWVWIVLFGAWLLGAGAGVYSTRRVAARQGRRAVVFWGGLFVLGGVALALIFPLILKAILNGWMTRSLLTFEERGWLRLGLSLAVLGLVAFGGGVFFIRMARSGWLPGPVSARCWVYVLLIVFEGIVLGIGISRLPVKGWAHQPALLKNRDRNVFFLNEGGRFRAVGEPSGLNFAGYSSSAVYLDFDNDGDLDVAVNNTNAPAKIFRNDAPFSHRWVRVTLEGDPLRGVTRDALGGRVCLWDDREWEQCRFISAGNGYLSMESRRLHWGLGEAESVEGEILWPNGEVQTGWRLQSNRCYRVRQGSDVVETSCAP